jgi:YD repeat-containing protein
MGAIRETGATVGLMLGLLSVGCGTERSPRALSEVTSETVSEGVRSTATVEYEYEDEYLDLVQFASSNGFAGQASIEYDDDLVTELDTANNQGKKTRIELDYDDERLRALTQSNGVETRTTDFGYDDDGRLETFETRIGDDATEYRYSYDSVGRLERIASTSHFVTPDGLPSSSASALDFRWDDDDALERVQRECEGCDPMITEFTYDDDGRLDEIELYDGRRYTFSYNDDGLIEEIRVASSGTNSTTWKFDYEESDVLGVTFYPPVAYGEHFDMEGKPFVEPSDILALPADFELD